MCFFKSLTASFDDLESFYSGRDYDHLLKEYEGSFQAIQSYLAPIRGRLSILMEKDAQIAQSSLVHSDQLYNLLLRYSKKAERPEVYSSQEVTEMKRHIRDLERFQLNGISSYYENGFDRFATPVITSGDPQNFKMFHWGLIPTEVTDVNEWLKKKERLNCQSEYMDRSEDFAKTFATGQRCLIPVSGFYEWRTLDEDETIKIPYYVTFADQKPRMMAGLYSRWRDSPTGEYYYSYVLLTTKANAILEYVHNKKKRMPVFMSADQWDKWLDRKLPLKEAQQMCQPFMDPAMRAYTITKWLTKNDVHRNEPQVRYPMNYNPAIEQAIHFLQTGDHKQALSVFKEAVAQTPSNAKEIEMRHLELAAKEPIIVELSLVA